MSTIISRDELATARARAGRIRQGIHDYLTTLAEISNAYNERDWVALGYADWQSYIDEEFGADRLRLSPEHRQKAVAELRLAGMSQRAIGATLGVSPATVNSDLSGVQNQTPETIQGTDGKSYQTQRPAAPEVDAEREPALEGVVESPVVTWSEEEERLRKSVLSGEAVVASQRGRHEHLISWAIDNGLYIRIDRRTDWGNPFELPVDGDRDTVIANYRDYYLPHKPSLLGRLAELRGKVLGCWCAPEPCHGDVLASEADR